MWSGLPRPLTMCPCSLLSIPLIHIPLLEGDNPSNDVMQYSAYHSHLKRIKKNRTVRGDDWIVKYPVMENPSSGWTKDVGDRHRRAVVMWEVRVVKYYNLARYIHTQYITAIPNPMKIDDLGGPPLFLG